MLTWWLADLKTGAVISELPLKVTGLERTIGQKVSQAATLDVHDASCPPNWGQLIDPRRALVVPVDDDVPLAGYFIQGAVPGEPTVPFTLVSLDGIFERVFCRDHDFYEDEHDEADAVAALLSDVVVPSFGFELDVTQTGKGGDHSYSWYEDRTVGSAVSDISGQKDGPEVTTRVAWEDGRHRRFIKTIEIGPQVGRLIPSTVFENAHTTGRKRPRDFTDIAVHVVATGDGGGDARPMSDPVVDQAALEAGIPQWESRVTAPTIDDEDGLTRYAEDNLARRRNGTQTWETSLLSVQDGAPRLVRDFDAGDIVTVAFDATRHDPASWHGRARVIGWRAEVAGRQITTVTPVFWQPGEDEA